MSQWVSSGREAFIVDSEAGRVQCAGCGGTSCTVIRLPEGQETSAIHEVAACNRCREELRLLSGLQRHRFIAQMRDTAQARYQRAKKEKRQALVATAAGLLRPV